MICTNIGRKTDRIIRKRELLMRKWLFGKFKVKLFYPRKSRTKQERSNGWDDPCHLLRKHGPQNELHVIKDRILQTTGDAMARRIDDECATAASRFGSMEDVWQARELFLRENQTEMETRAERIDEGRLKNNNFGGVTVMPHPIGEGFVHRDNGDLEYVGNIQAATFRFKYEKGVWYEITGFPKVRDPLGLKAK